MEALLNKPSSLCFNKEDFMVRDFTVDKFVSNYRKYASLETMLEDLGLYNKILCAAMVELINKDYTDFVNLSSNLVGLDKSIKNLSFPLEKLRSEVENMKLDLNGTLSTSKSKFVDYTEERKKKVLAHRVQSLFEGLIKIEHFSLANNEMMIPSESLERIALDFNLVQFLISKINLKEIEDKKVVLKEISDNLNKHLKCLFLRSVSEKDVHGLCKILRIYAVINKEREIEGYFCQTIVKPYMRKHITEEHILKLGLAMVCNKVLDFIPTKCAEILNATRGGLSKRSTEVVSGYDFLVNAVWPEIVHCFELISPVHVYAPGDANQFHTNYTTSMNFLKQFEHHCGIQTSVQRLRKHSSYIKFINMWNVDVHYQIRFQEIAGKFESSILEESKALSSKNLKHLGKEKYLLNPSSSLLECVRLCWDDKILIQPLYHKFYGLTLQLISRYSKWTQMSLINTENKHHLLSPVELAVVIRDVELLTLDLKLFYDQKISAKVSKVLVTAAFQESIKTLENVVPFGRSILIKTLLKQCCSHLKLIMDIPRLYRKTNRNIPSKASPYVSEVFDSVTEFLSETQLILSDESKKLCLKEVIDGIIAECFTIVQDVLTSIKKMEDSLKILKRARDKPLSDASSGVISDDDKIRRQLVIDINSMEERVQKLGLEVDSLKSFKDLKHLVISAERNITQNF